MAELYAKIDFREVELGSQKEILKACVESQHVLDQDIIESDDGATGSGMEVGDIIFNDTVCIERKEPKDFLKSMKEGHLEDQIDRMYSEYDHVFLLVSGSIEDLYETPYSSIPKEAVRAFVASLSVRWNTTPIFCDSERELAFMAIDVARKVFEPLERRPGKPEISVDDDLGSVGNAAMIADDVGPKTAKKIEESGQFWTVSDLCEASLEDLKEIEGIGNKTASKIKSTLS